MVDCKTNFREQYQNKLECRVCNEPSSTESEDHILVCPALSNEQLDVKFDDVFGNTDDQFKATQAFKKVLRKRKVYLDALQT